MLSEDFCGGALSDKGSVFATVGIRIRLIIYSWKGGGSGKEEKSRCRGEEGGHRRREYVANAASVFVRWR